ncbi:MAG: hypothetical protein K9K93_07020 [Acholeplasmataceae bacterium]|nr:hypothetical protein [Acholeplasmataceae bacterium]
MLKRLVIRMIVLSAISFLVCLSAMFIMGGFRPFAAMTLCFYVPLVWILFFGNIRHRIANILPLVALVTYLFLGFYQGLWNEASIIFLFVPYVGLTLKPKRALISYLTIFLSTILLIVRLVTGFQFPILPRVLIIVLIYVIFMPPMIQKKLSSFRTKVTRDDV